MLQRYGHGTPDDWLERNVYRRSVLGVSILLVIDVIAFGALGLTVWAVQLAWIPIWAAGVVNGLGHWWGYRNFETTDTATNLTPGGVWIGGEELHNNHHAFPSSAKFSLRKFEFDIGWAAIRLFKALRLATVLRVAPTLDVRPNMNLPDADTVKALLSEQAVSTSGNGLDAPYVDPERAVFACLSHFQHAAPKHRSSRVRETLQALVDNGHLTDHEERLRLAN